MTNDQISFYDESLRKQVEGSYVSDGKEIHVSSVYGVKSAPYNDLGASIDYNSQVLLARKLLSELARDADQKVLSEKVKVLSELARDAEKDSATSHSLKKAA